MNAHFKESDESLIHTFVIKYSTPLLCTNMEKKDSSTHPREGISGKEKRTSIRRLLAEFCGYTTAHGLGRLSASTNVFRRLIWSLFCMGAFTMFVLQVYNLFVIYLSRPVSTVVKVEHESRAKFPAVTICNMNMLRAGQIPDSYIMDILATITPNANESSLEEQANNSSANASLPTDEPFLSTDDSFRTTDDPFRPTDDPFRPTDDSFHPTDDYFHPTDEYYPDEEYYEDDYLTGFSSQEAKEIESQIEEALLAKVAKENDSTLFALGHQFEDFVFECSFRGYDCRNYTRYWHNFWDFRHGNCFTFNGGVDDFGKRQKVLQSFSTGPAGGLKLKLFIEQSQYIEQLTHTAGARVVIHDQGQMPFPDNEGHDALPSRSTSFAIRKTAVERVDPFGNGSCISEDDVKSENIYAKKFNFSYSRQACLNSCHANKQISDCGCVEAQFPADAEICDIKNRTTARCLASVLGKLLLGELNCEANCPTPCKEVLFRTSLSMGEWPSYGYEQVLKKRVQDREVFAEEENFGYYLKENFLQVRIFFEQLNFERVVESVSYERVNLVADIGGQLGLWIGISVLTCCELLELLLLIIRSVFTKMSTRNVIHVKPASSYDVN